MGINGYFGSCLAAVFVLRHVAHGAAVSPAEADGPTSIRVVGIFAELKNTPAIEKNNNKKNASARRKTRASRRNNSVEEEEPVLPEQVQLTEQVVAGTLIQLHRGFSPIHKDTNDDISNNTNKFFVVNSDNNYSDIQRSVSECLAMGLAKGLVLMELRGLLVKAGESSSAFLPDHTGGAQTLESTNRAGLLDSRPLRVVVASERAPEQSEQHGVTHKLLPALEYYFRAHPHENSAVATAHGDSSILSESRCSVFAADFCNLHRNPRMNTVVKHVSLKVTGLIAERKTMKNRSCCSCPWFGCSTSCCSSGSETCCGEDSFSSWLSKKIVQLLGCAGCVASSWLGGPCLAERAEELFPYIYEVWYDGPAEQDMSWIHRETVYKPAKKHFAYKMYAHASEILLGINTAVCGVIWMFRSFCNCCFPQCALDLCDGDFTGCLHGICMGANFCVCSVARCVTCRNAFFCSSCINRRRHYGSTTSSGVRYVINEDGTEINIITLAKNSSDLPNEHLADGAASVMDFSSSTILGADEGGDYIKVAEGSAFSSKNAPGAVDLDDDTAAAEEDDLAPSGGGLASGSAEVQQMLGQLKKLKLDHTRKNMLLHKIMGAEYRPCDG